MSNHALPFSFLLEVSFFGFENFPSLNEPKSTLLSPFFLKKKEKVQRSEEHKRLPISYEDIIFTLRYCFRLKILFVF